MGRKRCILSSYKVGYTNLKVVVCSVSIPIKALTLSVHFCMTLARNLGSESEIQEDSQ